MGALDAVNSRLGIARRMEGDVAVFESHLTGQSDPQAGWYTLSTLAAAKKWVYAQKVVPFSKLSNHQTDIEARAKAAA